MIIKYKEFCNESLKDQMKGKSDDDIKKSLSNLSDSDKIKNIIKYKLSYYLLPNNLTINGHLVCSYNQLTKLPDNLIVNGNLNCNTNKLIKLPDNLIVNGNLDCSYNQLKELPDNLIVKGNLYCYNNQLPRSTKKPIGVKGEMEL